MKQWLSSSPHKDVSAKSMKNDIHRTSARARTLTWSSLTGDRELLYQGHGGVGVVVGVQDPPVGALSKKNPVENRANVRSDSVGDFAGSPRFQRQKEV